MDNQIDELVVKTITETMLYGPHKFPNTFAEQLENVAEFNRRVDLAKAAPEKHKMDRLYADGSYKVKFIDVGTDGRGWSVRFAWTATPNVVGYYSTWKEVSAPGHSRAEFTGRLSMYSSSKKLEVCERIAKNRALKFITKQVNADA